MSTLPHDIAQLRKSYERAELDETASKADPNPLLLLGLYADEYRRINGQWRITHTRLEVVWPQRNSSREQCASS